MYVPQAHQHVGYDTTVKTRVPPATLTTALLAEVRKLDAQLPVTDIKTLDQYQSPLLRFRASPYWF
ncbi:MAG: hypothetical protein U0Y68_05405 [Blastocatellia bacterium]